MSLWLHYARLKLLLLKSCRSLHCNDCAAIAAVQLVTQVLAIVFEQV